jgi:tropomyosin
LKESLQHKENEVNSLNNKVSLLEMELERAEKRIHDIKQQHQNEEANNRDIDSLQRKITLLETSNETNERKVNEMSEK